MLIVIAQNTACFSNGLHCRWSSMLNADGPPRHDQTFQNSKKMYFDSDVSEYLVLVREMIATAFEKYLVMSIGNLLVLDISKFALSYRACNVARNTIAITIKRT